MTLPRIVGVTFWRRSLTVDLPMPILVAMAVNDNFSTHLSFASRARSISCLFQRISYSLKIVSASGSTTLIRRPPFFCDELFVLKGYLCLSRRSRMPPSLPNPFTRSPEHMIRQWWSPVVRKVSLCQNHYRRNIFLYLL